MHARSNNNNNGTRAFGRVYPPVWWLMCAKSPRRRHRRGRGFRADATATTASDRIVSPAAMPTACAIKTGSQQRDDNTTLYYVLLCEQVVLHAAFIDIACNGNINTLRRIWLLFRREYAF